ncbi:MAG: cellobiose system component [Thermoanaerobacterium sp.]|uniref:PTS cellobiose transporter subunit IIC n=1 Tax=Thermoanaerobacterium thermosaccharolyticum TaxID=1517 RepID=UPI00264A51F5|nr:cellobiose system component [Thermoanaerobacterium sp.]MDN5317899.1 cellobiose system component [Thermoanaerobacterium sp.]WHE06343.1 PTS cellobiose transporter subunit IIC [Thermoanaerobacterium thermosaccharolyticum]
MSKFTDSLEEKLMPIAGKIAENRYLASIRDGFMLAVPLITIGAVFLLLANLPIPGYSDFMAKTFGPNWNTFFMRPFEATMSVMSIFVVFGIAYSLAGHYKIDGLSTAAAALAAFLIFTPYIVNYTPEGAKKAIEVSGGIPVDWMGSKGLFVGMLTAILTVEIVRFVVKKGWVIKMPKGVPPAVEKAFSALIPAAIVAVIVDIIRLIFTWTPYGTVHQFIYTVLQIPLTRLGDTLPATLLASFLEQFFWSFGIHGANLVGSVMGPIWLALAAENLQAFQAGHALPHIITQQFHDMYMLLGGSGSTLGLVLGMLFFSKSKQVKSVGKLAIAPGIFNINEPVIFGMPIVLNPIMIIPFILTPLVLTILTYIVMILGLVARPSGVIIPWTTPPVIGGLLVSGISGAIWQLIELVISFFIYLPFLRVVDRQYLEQEQAMAVESQKG